MIDYPTFLQLAESEDIRVMNLLSQGQTLEFDEPAEADAMFLRILRLDEAGFIVRLSRHYTRRDGIVWQGFEALIEPSASTFLARAASERVQLSRDPLPVT